MAMPHINCPIKGGERSSVPAKNKPRAASLAVSDRALLRVLQHAGGVDIEALRNAVARSIDTVAMVANGIGASEFVIVADGYSYVVKNGVVVTVLPGTRP
jgi:hypothetical protein